MRPTATAAVVGVAAFAWSAGCGRTAPDRPPSENVGAWQSGSRLRARTLDGGGGAKLFVSWFDSALGITCAFTRAQDGVTRCLPTEEVVSPSPRGFSDDRCTQPLVNVLPPTRHPYYRVSALNRCDPASPSAVKAFGEAVVQVPFGLDDSGGCHRLNASESPWFPVSDVDPSRFVAASEELAGGAPLGIRVLHGEDGSREHAQLVDATAGRVCDVAADHFTGAPAACLPAHLLAGTVSEMNLGPFYADAACTVATAVPLTCAIADVALTTRAVGCTIEVDLLALGPLLWDGQPTDEPAVFRKGADCQRQQPSLRVPFYAVAGPVTHGTYPIASLDRVGTGRLRAPLRFDARGLRVRNVLPGRGLPSWPSLLPTFLSPRPQEYRFFDDVHQWDCSPLRAADGTLRCLPSGLLLLSREAISHPGCRQPVWKTLDVARCPPRFIGVRAPDVPGADTTVTEIRAVGRVMSSRVPPAESPGACVPADDLLEGQVVYALAPPIPPSDFPAIAEVTE